MLVAVVFVIFAVLAALPGDAASRKLGMDATPEALAELRARYGLDRPLLERLFDWAGGVLRGDWGANLGTGAPVGEQLGTALARSGAVIGLALPAILLLGVGLGILTGLRPGSRLDRAVSITAVGIICTPEFVLGTLLALVFAGALHWLPAVSLVPVGGTVFDRPAILVLPAAAIALLGSAVLLRQVRALVARLSDAPHVEAARLAGIPELRVVTRHLLPGALPPLAQAVAATVPFLVGGAVVIERVFAYPGLGTMLVDSVTQREPNALMGCVVILVGASLAAYLLADLVRTPGAPARAGAGS